jgi:hypothetical protein
MIMKYEKRKQKICISFLSKQMIREKMLNERTKE